MNKREMEEKIEKLEKDVDDLKKRPFGYVPMPYPVPQPYPVPVYPIWSYVYRTPQLQPAYYQTTAVDTTAGSIGNFISSN